MPWRSHDGSVELHLGDCREVLPVLPSDSVDFVFTDPPYPYIKRPYGYWDEKQWRDLIDPVIEECRRILKPTGSMVLVLQPNSEHVGQLRPWLWRFMADWCERWNQVQDAYWWNYTAPPTVHTIAKNGLMRPSVKILVWLGDSTCYRSQERVLWSESDSNIAERARLRAKGNNDDLVYHPSGTHINRFRMTATSEQRNGTTPFNMLPVANANSVSSSGAVGHGAGTPIDLALWWLRYCCPDGGLVLDPFLGAGTTALAAMRLCRRAIGIEVVKEHYDICVERVRSYGAYPDDESDNVEQRKAGKGQIMMW